MFSARPFTVMKQSRQCPLMDKRCNGASFLITSNISVILVLHILVTYLQIQYSCKRLKSAPYIAMFVCDIDCYL